MTSIKDAHAIKTQLDSTVIGQDSAREQLSVLLSMHLSWFHDEERMHRSPNAIMLGPTGVGKTHTIRMASEYLRIPFVAVDSTSLVPSGILGYQIEDILDDLVRAANNMLTIAQRELSGDADIELARRGIIFLDEFDKIAMRGTTLYSDSSLHLVQRRLLKLTEGAILGVGLVGHGVETVRRSMDTSGILILAGGAFAGIDDGSIRAKRPEILKRELQDPNVIISADIVNYGFMPELVARLPILIEYKALNESDLLKILNNVSVSPLHVWLTHFMQMDKQLVVTPEAKSFIANKATKLGMGARGLQQALFPSMAKIAFDVEGSPGRSYELSITSPTFSEPSRLTWRCLDDTG